MNRDATIGDVGMNSIELVCCLYDFAAVRRPCWIAHLSQEFTLLLLHSGLIPHCDLEHAFPEVAPVNVGVDEGLVPLGLGALLDCLRPPFTFITATETKKKTQRIKLIEFPVGFLRNINTSIKLLEVECSRLSWHLK